MNTAKKIYESDAQGVAHVDVPVGRPGQRVEVVVVWGEVDEASVLDQSALSTGDLVGARRAQLQRYATWTEDDLREFQVGLSAQRLIDVKLWT